MLLYFLIASLFEGSTAAACVLAFVLLVVCPAATGLIITSLDARDRRVPSSSRRLHVPDTQ